MDDLPRQKLRAILSANGRAVCSDGARMAELLTSVCPEHPREVELLSQALDELLADDALTSLGERPWKVVENQLVGELTDRHSMKEEDAQWAATSWGIALGELSPDQPGSQLPPLPTNGWEMKASELGALTQPRLSSSNQPGAPVLGQLAPSVHGQPGLLTPPEYPFAKTPQLHGMQVKTMVLMAFAIIAGLIAASMTFRMMDGARKENLYQNHPASYWSQKLQEPIQRKEVWQGHLKMMKDVDPAAALRQGDAEAVPVLIELLQDENSIVRQEAILILARIGGPAKSAVPALQQALNDPDEQVRARATTALRQIELTVETQAGPR